MLYMEYGKSMKRHSMDVCVVWTEHIGKSTGRYKGIMVSALSNTANDRVSCRVSPEWRRTNRIKRTI